MARGDETLAGPEAAKIATLTAREREVMALVGQGLKNRQIAAPLHISEATVGHHLSSIFAKLSVIAGPELAIYAYRRGLARFPRRPDRPASPGHHPP